MDEKEKLQKAFPNLSAEEIDTTLTNVAHKQHLKKHPEITLTEMILERIKGESTTDLISTLYEYAFAFSESTTDAECESSTFPESSKDILLGLIQQVLLTKNHATLAMFLADLELERTHPE